MPSRFPCSHLFYLCRSVTCIRGALPALILAVFPVLAGAQDYNLRFGPLLFDITGVAGIEYNDNINYSNNRPLDDIILSAGIDFGGTVELSRHLDFTLDVGARYEKYLQHSELDSDNTFLTLSPDTEAAARILADNHLIVIYDRLSYSSSAADAVGVAPGGGLVTDIAKYGRFTNVAGVDIDSDYNIFQTTLSFQREDVRTQGELFKFAERTTYRFSPSIRKQFTPAFTAGIGGSVSQTDYKTDFNNDGTSWSIGPFMTWRPNDNWETSVGASYVESNFDTGGGSGDNTGTSKGVNGRASVRHDLSRWYSHGVSIAHFQELGQVSNTTEVTRANYDYSILVTAETTLSGQLFAEHGNDSGGIGSESYDRYGFTIGAGYQIGRRTTLDLRYAWTEKDSDLVNRDYSQNRVILTVRHDF